MIHNQLDWADQANTDEFYVRNMQADLSNQAPSIIKLLAFLHK